MRILIDVNIWVSALISQSMRDRVGKILSNPDLIVLSSSNLIAEIHDTINRPKFARFVSQEDANAFLQIIEARVDGVSPTSSVKVCRDPDDDYLLAICQDADAHFLVTGDKDLLALDSFGATRILTLSDFEKEVMK